MTLPLQKRDCEALLLALSGKPMTDWNAVACLKERSFLNDDGELTPEGVTLAYTVHQYARILQAGVPLSARRAPHARQLQSASWRSGEILGASIVATESLILQATKAPDWTFPVPFEGREQKTLEKEVKKLLKASKWIPLRPSAYQVGGGLPGALTCIVFRAVRKGKPGPRSVVRIQSSHYDLIQEQTQEPGGPVWWLHPEAPVIGVKSDDAAIEGFCAFIKLVDCDWPVPEAGKL